MPKCYFLQEDSRSDYEIRRSLIKSSRYQTTGGTLNLEVKRRRTTLPKSSFGRKWDPVSTFSAGDLGCENGPCHRAQNVEIS